MKPHKPRIKLQLIDILFDIVALLSVTILVSIPFTYYNDLPDKIPIHFGLDGTPDRFGSPINMWFFTLAGVILYTGLTWIVWQPSFFKASPKLSKEGFQKTYTMTTRFIRGLNAIVTLAFAYIVYAQVQIVMNQQEGLGQAFVIAFVGTTLGITFYFVFFGVIRKKAKP